MSFLSRGFLLNIFVSQPNRNPAKHPQGACRIRKAVKPPTAAQRIRFGSEEQQNERGMSFGSTPKVVDKYLL